MALMFHSAALIRMIIKLRSGLPQPANGCLIVVHMPGFLENKDDTATCSRLEILAPDLGMHSASSTGIYP